MKENYFWIGGWHTVMAAIKNPKRKIKKIVSTVPLTNKDINKNSFEIVTQDKINKIFYPNSIVHQNIAALIVDIKEKDLNESLKEDNLKKIVILDNVTDPRNIGAVIRSAVAFGVDALLVKKRGFNSQSPSMFKASSGTIENIKIIECVNFSNSIDLLKKENFWIYGFSSEAIKIFDKKNLNEKNVFIFGSEDQGISKNIEKKCDFLFKINMTNKAESLNVSNAASIILYQAFE